MNGGLPDIAQNAVGGLTVELDKGRVDELDPGLGIGHPDGRGGCVGHQPEPGLALAQRSLGGAGLGDVGVDADQAAIAAVGLQTRPGVRVQNPPLAVMTAEAGFGGKGGLARRGLRRHRPDLLDIIGMDQGAEIEAVQRLRRVPEGALGGVQLDAAAGLVAHPQHDRGVFADQAELMFAIVDAGPAAVQGLKRGVEGPDHVTERRCDGCDEQADDDEVDGCDDPQPIRHPGPDGTGTDQ